MYQEADLLLSNGAHVNFNVATDVQGNPVISRLEICFQNNRKIPLGGIGAELIREIRINDLLALWFQESSQAFLSKNQEGAVLRFLKQPTKPQGRNGLPNEYYAALTYFYILQYEKSPSNPKAVLAELLNVSPKTLSTRLTQARKLGFLSSTQTGGRTSRAGGQMSAQCKKLITNLLGE